MSQENAERMRAAYDAWNRQDLAAFLNFFAPAHVFHTSGVFPSHDPVYRGRERLREFWEAFHDAWERVDIKVDRLSDLGDERVLALVNFDAVGRGSGVEVQREFAFLSTFEEGLVVETRSYASQSEALEAVGLSE
jgi:ketosteroid isomerase-like protein